MPEPDVDFPLSSLSVVVLMRKEAGLVRPPPPPPPLPDTAEGSHTHRYYTAISQAVLKSSSPRRRLNKQANVFVNIFLFYRETI